MGEEAGLLHPGFSINEAEIDFQATVDDYLYGYASIALEQHPDETEVELEEAYFRTLKLPSGLKFKAGRFYSGIGYLNHHHKHQWDFVDAPLVYRTFFANQYNDDGVQLGWIAPTKLYWEFAVEAFPGSNFPAAGGGNHIGSITAFTHLRNELSQNVSWQIGASYLHAKPNGREALLITDPFDNDMAQDDDDNNTYLFSGRNNTFGLDHTYSLCLATALFWMAFYPLAEANGHVSKIHCRPIYGTEQQIIN